VELVLDYIVERKRMDDLADSIVDGRFREQKVVRLCASQIISKFTAQYFTPGGSRDGAHLTPFLLESQPACCSKMCKSLAPFAFPELQMCNIALVAGALPHTPLQALTVPSLSSA